MTRELSGIRSQNFFQWPMRGCKWGCRDKDYSQIEIPNRIGEPLCHGDDSGDAEGEGGPTRGAQGKDAPGAAMMAKSSREGT